jgi:hypothetical protein
VILEEAKPPRIFIAGSPVVNIIAFSCYRAFMRGACPSSIIFPSLPGEGGRG